MTRNSLLNSGMRGNERNEFAATQRGSVTTGPEKRDTAIVSESGQARYSERIAAMT